ncbi:hypothetical protein RN001_004566 [Aquatica leii]|uniref:dolichyl-phosphate-mannose--protein mannosyltransferase n=1 Tax=Aquatica leii TaxID=1421715 RepID=A0AAN7PAW1_9COLE|nr:hypothetical protein RN001_004566 [Aquatica leii]
MPITIVFITLVRANYLCFGLQPVWFHATNIGLHATACVLFTRVCLCVAGLKPPFATLAGLLYATHPIHTEAVTGIVGRADVLACVFFLVSLLAYHGQPDGSCHVWTSVILGGLSMLAKETGVTVFLLNLSYDLYRTWPNIKRAIIEVKWTRETREFTNRTAKILASLGILLTIRLALLQGSLPKFSQQDNPTAFHPSFYVRVLTFCYLAAFNWWLLLCPATLSHDWQMGSVPLITSASDYRNIITCVFLGCVFLLSLRSLIDFENQKHVPLVLGLLLLVLPFLPAMNLLVTVGFVIAERVLYIPSLGCVLLVVYGIQLLWNAHIRHRQTIVGLGILLLVTSSFRVVIRNKDWRSRESLLRAGLLTLPHNAKMHYNYGNFLRDAARPELAVAHYNVALRLWPTYASAHNNLGTLISNEVEAEEHFLSAIRYSADHVNAHYNLGQLYRKTNRSSESEHMLKRCIRLEPTFTPAYIELARLRGPNNPSVGPLLIKVASLNPTDPYYITLYAHWLLDKGNYIKSIKYYWDALATSPSYQESMLGASRILRKFGQFSRLFQLVTRWQSIIRLRRGETPLNPHLYLHGWQLKTELSGKARAYDPDSTVLTGKRCVSIGSTENSSRTYCSSHCSCRICNKTVQWTKSTSVRRCSINRTRSNKYKPSTPIMIQHLLDTA